MSGRPKKFNSKSLIGVPVFLIFCSILNAQEESDTGAGAGAKGGKPGEIGLNVEKPWVDIENKLGLLRSKREAQTGMLKKLKEERDLLKVGSESFKEKQKEYLKAYNEWLKIGEDYSKMLNLLKYRYPERVLRKEIDAKNSMKAKTLEELEMEMGIDGKLNQVMRKTKSQYGNVGEIPKEEKKNSTSSGADPLHMDSLEVEEQIIIKK